ncbi:MAG: AAA family ATPase [Methanophagales archaeon]|nr:AAA family ATPase [Methanophagales archaeon]
MSYTIAVAGKGGTGKTTVSALLIQYLKNRSAAPILAIDADPTANLGEVIGLTVDSSIGATLEKFREELPRLPPGVIKNDYLQARLNEVLIEDEKVDLITMGRKEGAGCYCYPNQILREYMTLLAKSYPYMIIDNEAGMEHLSRKTTQKLDVLLLVSDATTRGVRTAGGLKALTVELNLEIKRIYLVICRAPKELNARIIEEIEKQGLELIQTIPEDYRILDYIIEGIPLTNLPGDSPAVIAISDLMEKIL